MEILLIAALLPAIALMVYVYKKDQVEKEPAGLVFRVFLLGALTGPIAGIVEGILFNVFEAVIPAGVLLVVVEYFIGVAVVEEACKYFCLNTIRTHPAFDYVFDAVVYSVAAALGFAALENVMYVFDGGLEVALTRAIFSVPGHMADGVVMGVFFGMARKRELHGNASGAKAFYWLAFLLPVIEHGFYDAALSLDSDLLSLLAMATDLAFIAVAFALIHGVSKNDAPLHPHVGPTGQMGSTYAPYQADLQQAQTSLTQHADLRRPQADPSQLAELQRPQTNPYDLHQASAQPYQQQEQSYDASSPQPPARHQGGPTVRYSSESRDRRR